MQSVTHPAIFLLANDRVLANVIRLLASLRSLNFDNRLFYIPFNEETYFLDRVFAAFGVERYEADLPRIDALGARIYDGNRPAEPYPYCLGKLRKLAFLSYPGQAIYLDADCVVTAGPEMFADVFGLNEPGIGYINTSPQGVYEDKPEALELRARSPMLTSGMIAKSRETTALADIERLFDPATILRFHAVRRRGGYVDQPLWNFMVDSDLVAATDLLSGRRISRITSLNADLTIAPDATVSAAGLPVLLLHLAGPALKETTRYRFLLDGLLTYGLRHLATGEPAEFAELTRFVFAH